MKIPYFPFYASDWLGSRTVRLMTDAQRGIYIQLLAESWNDPECGIPADRELLQKMLPGSRWSNIERVLALAFTSTDEKDFNGASKGPQRLLNARLLNEHRTAKIKSSKATDSAKYRWNKEKQNANAMRTLCDGNANQNQNQNQNKTLAQNASFEQFWNTYPRKQGKKAAYKAWVKISPGTELFDSILKAVEVQKLSEQWRKENGKFIPYPATWLNGERWNDETGTPKAPGEDRSKW